MLASRKMIVAAGKNCIGFLIVILSVLLPPNLCQTASDIEIIECGVTPEESKNIVNMHNEYRKLIATGKVPNQPRGVNLMKMKWDDQLANEAEKVAMLGIFQHKHIYDRRWPFVGQNIHIYISSKSSSERNWDRCLMSWFDEHNSYKYGQSIMTGKIGHYTQMVWANSDHVGCGYCSFKNVSRKSMPFQKLYVCNYGPAGNFIGDVPYKTGSHGCEELC